MAGFTLYFEWPHGGPTGEPKAHDLESESLDQAKLKAAMIYAGASFQRIPPEAYRIEGSGHEIVYRFPERAWRTG